MTPPDAERTQRSIPPADPDEPEPKAGPGSVLAGGGSSRPDSLSPEEAALFELIVGRLDNPELVGSPFGRAVLVYLCLRRRAPGLQLLPILRWPADLLSSCTTSRFLHSAVPDLVAAPPPEEEDLDLPNVWPPLPPSAGTIVIGLETYHWQAPSLGEIEGCESSIGSLHDGRVRSSAKACIRLAVLFLRAKHPEVTAEIVGGFAANAWGPLTDMFERALPHLWAKATDQKETIHVSG